MMAPALLAAGGALAAWALAIEPRRLVLRPRALTPPAWPRSLDGLRVAVLADLHAGTPPTDERRLRRIAARVNEAAPELVLILGDFLTHGGLFQGRVAPEAVGAALTGLSAPLGVFAVLGNHDWHEAGERMIRAADEAGIRVLEDEAATVRRAGQELWLAGVSDAWSRVPDLSGTLARVPHGAPVLVVTHSPDLFPRVPARVSLTLAGHTHAGQVNVPLARRLALPSAYGERFLSGHIEEDGRQLYVHPGIGNSAVPARLRATPEITLLTLGGGCHGDRLD